MRRSPTEQCHFLMRQQYGLITREQALEIDDITPDMVDGLVRRKRWEVVQRGIYRAAGGWVPPEQAHLAAVKRAGEGALLTGEALLALLKVESFDPAKIEPVVVVPDARRVRGVDFEVRYRPELPVDARTKIGIIPGTSPSRALVDFGRDARGQRFRTAFDDLHWRGLTDEERLRRHAVAALPQVGAAYVVRVCDSGILRMESERERDLLPVLMQVDPSIEIQQRLLPHLRVDFVWRDARIVVEYDGAKGHTAPIDRARDRRRRARLRAAGWKVVVVRNEQFADVEALMKRLAALRTARLIELGRR